MVLPSNVSLGKAILQPQICGKVLQVAAPHPPLICSVRKSHTDALHIHTWGRLSQTISQTLTNTNLLRFLFETLWFMIHISKTNIIPPQGFVCVDLEFRPRDELQIAKLHPFGKTLRTTLDKSANKIETYPWKLYAGKLFTALCFV